MHTVPITVAIPVGPHPANVRWLPEAIESVREQVPRPAEILLVDDGAGLTDEIYEEQGVRVYHTAWPVGVAGAFNQCVGAAREWLIVLMGSDDKLLPGCLEACWGAWEAHHDLLGYYWLPVRYSDGRPDQYLPCNAAMVTKDLWRRTGGIPTEAGVGAGDTMLISMLLAAGGRLGRLYQVGDAPLYWYRVHPEIDTLKHGAEWQGIIFTVRDLVTRRALEALQA